MTLQLRALAVLEEDPVSVSDSHDGNLEYLSIPASEEVISFPVSANTCSLTYINIVRNKMKFSEMQTIH